MATPPPSQASSASPANSAANGLVDVPPGLAGVAVTTTQLGDVRGAEGFYHYRQYSAVELAERRAFEDVWFLTFEGHLPDAAEARSFAAEVAAASTLGPRTQGALPALVEAMPDSPPMDVLRSALPIAAAEAGLRPVLDTTPAVQRQDAVRIAAVVPTLLTAIHRLQLGAEPLGPKPDLSAAANYLYQLSGTVPAPERVRALEQYLIATVDHGFNASTFTGRVVASTGADLGAAIASAVAALSGPRHGGAPSRVLDTLDQIGSPDRAREWALAVLAAGRRIMGFGHPVYRADDPRSVLLRQVANRIATTPEERALVAFAETVETEVLAVLEAHKPDRPLRTNVEFYSAVVMTLCGIPREMLTPTFATSRVVGWCANVLEQAADTKIIRPSARYVGPPPPNPFPPASDHESYVEVG